VVNCDWENGFVETSAKDNENVSQVKWKIMLKNYENINYEYLCVLTDF
jgi:hypothetical protein